MTSVQEGLRCLTQSLQRDGVPDAARDARLLLAYAMGEQPERMTLVAYDTLAEDVLNNAYIFASRRSGGEPTSHIIGRRIFYGRNFTVDQRVLDPRPETECLIAEALAKPFSKFLDLGTGSGAIAVTLAAERSLAIGTATDLSADALDVARVNALRHDVSLRVHFEQSDWYQAISGTYDLIVSNPPYIALDEMDGLQREVRLHEPRMALTDEGDGLGAYRVICRDAPKYLTSGGRLIVEIGPTQATDVSTLMHAAGLSNIGVVADLDGRDRVVTSQKS